MAVLFALPLILLVFYCQLSHSTTDSTVDLLPFYWVLFPDECEEDGEGGERKLSVELANLLERVGAGQPVGEGGRTREKQRYVLSSVVLY